MLTKANYGTQGQDFLHSIITGRDNQGEVSIMYTVPACFTASLQDTADLAYRRPPLCAWRGGSFMTMYQGFLRSHLLAHYTLARRLPCPTRRSFVVYPQTAVTDTVSSLQTASPPGQKAEEGTRAECRPGEPDERRGRLRLPAAMYPIDVGTDQTVFIHSAVDDNVVNKFGAAGGRRIATAGKRNEGGECLRAQRSATGLSRQCEKAGGEGAKRTRSTYNSASKQKQRRQRIDRQSDDPTDGRYEGSNEAYYGGNHAEDAGEYFVVRHGWRAAVMLCRHEVG